MLYVESGLCEVFGLDYRESHCPGIVRGSTLMRLYRRSARRSTNEGPRVLHVGSSGLCVILGLMMTNRRAEQTNSGRGTNVQSTAGGQGGFTNCCVGHIVYNGNIHQSS